MTLASVSVWTGTGFCVGTALAVALPRLLLSAPSHLLIARVTTALLTALAFGVLAWRFGYRFDLFPCSVLAAVGVALSVIDLLEQRLPSRLVYSGIGLVGVLLVASALLQLRQADLVRAVAGMAILVAFYLVLALSSGGGLGAGDVKLGGLLGLTLGWLSWPALLAATFLGWFTAALVWLLLVAFKRKPRDSMLPMAPFLLFGALLMISVMPD